MVPHAVRYCLRECQQKHWRDHNILCQAISSLAEQKYREDREKAGAIVSHLSPQEHVRVVRLVGRKSIVKCSLHGKETDPLWDSGAKLSIISHNWVRQNLSDYDVEDIMISELLGMAELDLKTANGTDLPSTKGTRGTGIWFS